MFKRILLVICTLWFAACTPDPMTFGKNQFGDEVYVNDFLNRWVVVNYWAEWCAPCRKEIPELNKLQLDNMDAEVLVSGVNFDKLQGAELGKAVENMGINFLVLADDPASRFRLPRPESLPATFIINNEGRLVATLNGEQTQASIEQKMRELGWKHKAKEQTNEAQSEQP